MSQITLTNDERVRALTQLGYTQREAAFLCLAALHGGFFLRRQYCRFIGTEAGKAVASLVDKVIVNAHATAVAGCHNVKVYHLSARPFYAVLGQEDNRNRRRRPVAAMKGKLMNLDFVLSHPSHRYLATEQDKVAYFTGTLGIDLSSLPAKLFRSPKATDASSRFFIDKFPIFIPEQGMEGSVAAFCYVDEGTATIDRFESYLKQYSRLFARLARFEVLYVAAREEHFASAEKRFRNLFAPPGANGCGAAASDPTRLLEHFRRRRDYETGHFESFDRAQLIRFRDERQEFTGRFLETLYGRWKASGDHAVREFLASHAPAKPLNGYFSTFLLEHSYDVFGR